MTRHNSLVCLGGCSQMIIRDVTDGSYLSFEKILKDDVGTASSYRLATSQSCNYDHG